MIFEMHFSQNKLLHDLLLYKKLQIDQLLPYRHTIWNNDSLYNELQNSASKFGN